MKGKDFILLGAVGIGAYFLFTHLSKKEEKGFELPAFPSFPSFPPVVVQIPDYSDALKGSVTNITNIFGQEEKIKELTGRGDVGSNKLQYSPYVTTVAQARAAGQALAQGVNPIIVNSSASSSAIRAAGNILRAGGNLAPLALPAVQVKSNKVNIPSSSLWSRTTGR